MENGARIRSVAIWIRQSKKLEIELLLDGEALRIYRLPSGTIDGARFPAANESPQDLLATVHFADVIGCHRMKGRSMDDRTAYFAVYSYPAGKFYDRNEDRRAQHLATREEYGTWKDNGVTKKNGKRQRCCFTLQIEGKYVYEDNATNARNWVDAIRSRIAFPEPPHLKSTYVVSDPECRRRRLYVLVNPHSGPGKALEIFQDHVMPVFAEANVACRLLVTENANHARDLVRGLDLEEWDGIVIVSGDGLVHEVINGLASRPDRAQALNIPIGVIPGGSGNALAAAACFTPGETIKGNFAVDAAVAVARPVYRPLQLIRVEMRGRNTWSFLSVGWGLLSDIDIESERFRRSLGSARFTAGALIRVLNLRKYRARISYLPVDDTSAAEPAINGNSAGSGHIRDKITDSAGAESEPVQMKRSSTQYYDDCTTERLANVHRARSACPYDGAMDSSPEFSGETHLVAATPSSEPSGSPFQVRFDLGTKSDPMTDCDTTTDYRKGDLVKMPNIDDPVPSDWKVIEDELILFYGVYLDRISADVPYAPISRFDDNCIYLTFIRTSSVTKAQLVKFLLALERAEHLKMPCFETIPVKAFRLDRLSSGPSDIVAIDGELISGVEGPIQACVTNYSATIMTAH